MLSEQNRGVSDYFIDLGIRTAAMDELQVPNEGPVWSNLLYVFEPSSLLLIGLI